MANPEKCSNNLLQWKNLNIPTVWRIYMYHTLREWYQPPMDSNKFCFTVFKNPREIRGLVKQTYCKHAKKTTHKQRSISKCVENSFRTLGTSYSNLGNASVITNKPTYQIGLDRALENQICLCLADQWSCTDEPSHPLTWTSSPFWPHHPNCCHQC